MTYLGVVEDDDMQECLDCGYHGKDHAEFDVNGQDQAEVVCPKCHSSYYFIA